ncbi:MAG: PIG-L family deacetylase, partial [Dehalococcoidia bacterium]|nr:PIG-L family deacetylase [Dehalococcoidia bacterium]
LTFPELLEEGLGPHKVREVWVMGHPDPNNYVDVTGYIDVAIKSLQQHESQVSGNEVATHMRNWRSRTGDKVGFQYAEAFRRFRLG